MDKIVRHTIVITTIETWTVTWGDGTKRTVTYHAKRLYQPLPSAFDETLTRKKTEANNSEPGQGRRDASSCK
jgi:hypothetical protein